MLPWPLESISEVVATAEAAVRARDFRFKEPRVALLHRTTKWIGEKPVTRYSLYHSTFHDLIREKDQVREERVNLRDAERRIGRYLYKRELAEDRSAKAAG